MVLFCPYHADAIQRTLQDIGGGDVVNNLGATFFGTYPPPAGRVRPATVDKRSSQKVMGSVN